MGELARHLNFWDIYLMSLGQIIGAGIFILIGKAAKHANNQTWLAFVIAGILSILSGFSYVELSQVFKSNDAENDYISSVFGKPVGLVSILILLLIGIFTVTTVALGMGEYIEKKLNLSKTLSAIGIIILFAIVNIAGVKISSDVNKVATNVEFWGLIALIVGAFFSVKNSNIFTMPKSIIPDFKVMYGSLIAMFAYMGFETTVRLTKEAKNPERDIPLALITSIITSTILYVAVSWIVTNVVGLKNLSKSATPVEDAANAVFGNGAGPIFSFIAFISISNTILLNLLGNSRMLHSLSEEYKILEFLKPINKTTQTPIIAIIVASVLSIMALLFRDIEKTAVFTTSLFFIILALVNMSLVVLHFQKKHDDKFAKTFTGKINNKFPIIPIVAFLSCCGIMSCCLYKN